MTSGYPAARTQHRTAGYCCVRSRGDRVRGSAAVRGPWLDEFAAMFISDPALPLLDTFRNRWRLKSYPPLFNLLARLWAALGRWSFGAQINLIYRHS